jgi:hypothetical protein
MYNLTLEGSKISKMPIETIMGGYRCPRGWRLISALRGITEHS